MPTMASPFLWDERAVVWKKRRMIEKCNMIVSVLT